MFDPISLAAGATILCAGFLAGRFRRPAAKAPQITATCECTHSLSMHAGDGGQCNASVYRGGGREYSSSFKPCACLHYIGPQPITSMFTLPTLPEEN